MHKLTVFSLLFILGCKPDLAKIAAKRFCSCLKSNHVLTKADQNIVGKKCSDVLVNDFYYYKVYHIDMNDSIRRLNLASTTTDSAEKFELDFQKNIEIYCCKETWLCD